MRALGLPATMLRPAAFMENYYIDQVEVGLLQGKLVDGPQPDTASGSLRSIPVILQGKLVDGLPRRRVPYP